MGLFILIIAYINWPERSTEEGLNPVIKIAYLPLVDQKSTTTLSLHDNNTFDYTELTHLDSATFSIEYGTVEATTPVLFNFREFILF